MVHRFLKRYDELANPIGMHRHRGKGEISLPPEAPQPRPDHPLLDETRIVHGGVLIAGGCFGGGGQAVIDHGLAKVRALRPRIDGIIALADVNTHAAMRMLGDCANKALDYYLRITPPSLAAPGPRPRSSGRTSRRHVPKSSCLPTTMTPAPLRRLRSLLTCWPNYHYALVVLATRSSWTCHHVPTWRRWLPRDMTRCSA